ncbi:MAG: hypothetical protein ACYCVH_12100 [Ignavibacteriaceae bacterium]
MKKLIVVSFVAFLAFSNISCSIYQTLINISRLKFKLGNVDRFVVSGVNFEGKKSASDFKPIEVLKLTAAIVQRTFPVSFTLNVEVKNPNDGTGGYARTDATIKSFPWSLYVDDKQTISGNIESPVAVPGTGEVTVIPIQIHLDLFRFFRDKDYESLINLALAISGNKGTSSKLALYAQPTVATPIGDITYPQQLKIVNLSFTN